MKKLALTALMVLALTGLGTGVSRATLIAGDFSAGVTDTTDAQLDIDDLDDGWISRSLRFGNGTAGVATTDSGDTYGHILAQVFSNTQTGSATISFDWNPASSEELNYAVYGYNSASGDVVYINTAFSNNGPVALGGGTTLVSTFPPLTGNGVTGSTTSAAFDITGYTEVAVAFWQPASATGGVLDNVAITLVPEPSSTALLGFGGLALILRRRR